MYYFNGTPCTEVVPLLKSVTVVITRDKYVLPPEAYTYDDNSECHLTIAPLLVSELYVRLGLFFMNTYYTKFDNQNNEV